MRASTWMSCFTGASAAAAVAAAAPAGRAAAEAEVLTDAHAARCAVLQARECPLLALLISTFIFRGLYRIRFPDTSCRDMGVLQRRSVALGPQPVEVLLGGPIHPMSSQLQVLLEVAPQPSGRY